MGRVRARGRRDWPDGLYERRRGDRVYYYFRVPGGTKEVPLGRDLKAAKQAVALYLSRSVSDPVSAALSKIEQPASTVSEHFGWFKTEALPERRTKRGAPLAKKTLYEYGLMLDHAIERLGPNRSIANVDRRAVSDLLEAYPPRMSNRYRGLLGQVFRYAVARGLRADNPVDATIERVESITRQRLTREAFDAIRSGGPPWLQRAMDLALWSLQRREDIVLLTEAAWSDGKLSVRQKKVEGYGTGLLRITPGERLRAAIISCLNSPDRLECPYLVHRVPQKRIKADWRTHERQVAPEALTREFARLRDALGVCDHLAPAARPTWHEIRALGGDVYRESLGWSNEQVQALMGHASVEMTRAYLDRHGDRWQEVAAG
ncbi:MAG: phage integrase Arm DNA-binding domain-containing protein [Proteobacteria bacterium]|nr:phage integrase Arm DNA-binding domain-containing protein [Pseudomonadota bacterium]